MAVIRRRPVIWQARHDNGWIAVVAEQPDGTFAASAGPGEAAGVDYVEGTPEHAQADALFALNRKSGHATRARPDAQIGRCTRKSCSSRRPMRQTTPIWRRRIGAPRPP